MLRRQTCKPEKVGEHFCHTISNAHLRLWEEYDGNQPDDETLAGLVDLAATTLAVIDNRIADVFGVLAKPVKLVTAELIDLLVELVIAGMQRLKALDVKESGESASQEKPDGIGFGELEEGGAA